MNESQRSTLRHCALYGAFYGFPLASATDDQWKEWLQRALAWRPGTEVTDV